MSDEEVTDFSALLNHSTPHAPTDPADLRQRLDAARRPESGGEPADLDDVLAESEPPPWLLGLASREREERPAVRFEPDDDRLEGMLAAARELRDRAANAEFHGEDDGRTVRATVDGGGAVRGLRFAERATDDPRALGPAVSSAVMRAKAAAEQAQAADVAELFPEVDTDPGNREELLAFAEQPSHPFAGDLPYEAQNRIAEAHENLRKLADARVRHEEATYSHDLEDRLGRLSMNGARTELAVEFRARLPHDLKAPQLAARLVAAFGALEAEIDRGLNTALRRIPLGETTFGDFLNDVERRY